MRIKMVNMRIELVNILMEMVNTMMNMGIRKNTRMKIKRFEGVIQMIMIKAKMWMALAMSIRMTDNEH